MYDLQYIYKYKYIYIYIYIPSIRSNKNLRDRYQPRVNSVDKISKAEKVLNNIKNGSNG